jgi:hypothetical protein
MSVHPGRTVVSDIPVLRTLCLKKLFFWSVLLAEAGCSGRVRAMLGMRLEDAGRHGEIRRSSRLIIRREGAGSGGGGQRCGAVRA